MIINLLKITFRTIIKNKLFSLINIGGLIIGISCFLLILIWVQFETGFEEHIDDADDIFRIIYSQQYADQTIQSAVSPAPLGPALKREYPDVVDFTRYSIFFGEVLLSTQEEKHYETSGAYADPGFLDMFAIDFIHGDKTVALNDPYSVILTESLAKKYFRAQNPINEIIHLETFAPLKVTGIIKDLPNSTHLQFDFLVPYILFEKWGTNLDDWNNWGHQYTYLKLKKDTDIISFENNIQHYLDQHSPEIPGELSLQYIKDIHLDTSLNYDNYSVLRDRLIVNIFLIIAFVILIIACLNFINLTTAQYFDRTKESGVRKILGASRQNLIIQYLLESTIIAFIAIHISLMVIEILRLKIEFLTLNKLMLDYSNLWTYAILLAILILVGILSGFYPSIILSSLKPVEILKSKFSKPKSMLSIRKLLVIIQFVLASVMVLISIYSYKQLKYIETMDLGYSQDHIIAVQLRRMDNKHDVFKEQLLQNKDISHVSYGSSLTTINSGTSDQLDWQGKENNTSFEVFSSSVDYDYIEMFQLKIINGRSFSKDFPSDETSAFILNESAVSAINLEDPVGKQITYRGREGQVIGIVKDFNYSTLYYKIEPLIISVRKDWRFFLFARIEPGSYEYTLKYINDKWNELNPEFPFKYTFVSDDYNSSYEPFNKNIQLILNFTMISIIIAILGLYALTSYITKSRTKEIGIRKVIGASVKSILLILNLDFLKLIGIAYILSMPVAYFTIKNWMQLFAYKMDITITLFIQAGIIVMAISLLTISIQVIYIALKNPVESLRYE